jgi:hypothetical protein
MVDWLAGRSLVSPGLWVRRRVKKWGADRQALIREGSAVVTPVIQLAKEIGPGGVMWGDDAEITQRFVGWSDRWDELRTGLLTYANYHPSEKVNSQAHALVPAIVASFGSARYLSLRSPGSDTMDSFHAAEQRQTEAVALAEELMETIRRY